MSRYRCTFVSVLGYCLLYSLMFALMQIKAKRNSSYCKVPIASAVLRPKRWCRNYLTTRLVRSDWCLQPSQLLKGDEGEQAMQIGLESACWHLTQRMVIKNTLWQRQHLVVHLMHQPNSSVGATLPWQRMHNIRHAKTELCRTLKIN